MRLFLGIMIMAAFTLLTGCTTTDSDCWIPLFDGETTQGWRGYGQDRFPEKGWEVVDGCLHVIAGGGGGDIISCESFNDFDLMLEWKVAEKANSGIMFLVSEEESAPWQTGPEFQILDDIGHGLTTNDMHSSGALYDLYAPPEKKPVKAPGEWNEARIVLQNHRLQLWHNGCQIVDCDLSSDDWAQRVAKSKFHVYANFGKNKEGHLSLQDHGNDVWFRNIRIRELSHCDDS